MLKISAETIEEALLKASKELNTEILNLDYEIIQYPASGIFGLGKKQAQIVASIKTKDKRHEKNEQINAQDSKIESTNKPDSKNILESKLDEIKLEVNALFKNLPFNIDEIEVSIYDTNTILFHFKGQDSALLIGEKGYRYKAISYLLFNWINAKYHLNTRLEIECFLASQENMIDNYLNGIIDQIATSTKAFQTKPLDGILGYIALKKLRARFPDRFSILKTNEYGENYIIINPK